MIHRLNRNSREARLLARMGKTGKTIAGYIPKTVELHQMSTPVRRMMIIGIELVVGLLVIGALFLALFYYRLDKGAIDLDFIVPSIERAINDQLADLSVRIESAFVGKNTYSSGVHFRLRNISLFNKQGEAIASAPLAAVDLNGRALIWGQIAPSQVVFIQPVLNISSREGGGFSLSYGKPLKTGDKIADLLQAMEDKPRQAGGSSGVLSNIGRSQFMKAVTAAFEEARSHRNTASYLTQFGVRDATVNLSTANMRLSWKIPDFIIDLKHSRKGSLISGIGKLGMVGSGADTPPWKFRFLTRQFEKTQDLQLDVVFKDVVSSSLQKLFPAFKGLKYVDIPAGGKISTRLESTGELQSAFANILLEKGKLKIPWLNEKTDGIDGISLVAGELKLAYSKKVNKLHILPSTIKWGDNRTIVTGMLEPLEQGASAGMWSFALKGSETRLAARDIGLGSMIIDEWWISGSLDPQRERLDIAGFFLRAGNATINLKGHVKKALSSPGIFLKGKFSNISIPVLKRLWPDILATGARKWVGNNLLEGRVARGNMEVAIPSDVLAALSDKGDLPPESIKLNVELGDLVVNYLPGLVPLNIPKAEISIAGRQFGIKIPEARTALGKGASLQLSHGSFTIADLRKHTMEADISFHVAGNAEGLRRFLEQPELGFDHGGGWPSGGTKGAVQGIVSMHMPLKDDLKQTDISLKGDLRIRNLRARGLFDGMSVDGGNINIKLTEKAMDARGKIFIKDLPVRLSWQHIFGKASLRQPPIRLSAELDRKGRKKMGLSALDAYLEGKIPVVVTLAGGSRKTGRIQARADLTNARIFATPLGWKKAPGTAAVLQFDVLQRSLGLTELKNFSLAGNQLVAEGTVLFDRSRSRLHSFDFPSISFYPFRGMSLKGKRKNNGVMDVVAYIDSLDGGRLLRERLFSRKKRKSSGNRKKAGMDVDLQATIGRITGNNNTFITKTKILLKRRGGKIAWMDFRGRLNGMAEIVAVLVPSPSGRRVVKAQSDDAGSVFRMIGLYPSIHGGQLSLRVNLDQGGATEKKGTLWVRDFYVLSTQTVNSDPASMEAFKNDFIAAPRPRKGRARRRIMQTKLQFDKMKVPFSYGDGQFIMHNSYVNGPVLGATLRGKIDFRTERMKLGGTYVPLYGLNSAIGEIPVLSDLLVGRQGEGVFGVTFAIEGSTRKPTVIVNPVSLLTPGVFRQIFDFNSTARQQQFRKLPESRRKSGLRRNRSRTPPR